MKFGFYIILTILLGALLAQNLIDFPGHISIYYKDFVVDISLVFSLLCLSILLVSIYILSKVLSAPSFLLNKVKNSKRDKSNKLLENSILSMSKGDYHNAQRSALKALPYCDNPIIAYTQIIQAYDSQNKYKERDEWIKKAYEKLSHAETHILLIQANTQLKSSNYESAKVTLEKINKIEPDNTIAAGLLADLQIKFSEWKQLENNLALLKSLNRTEEEKLFELELVSITELIKDAKTSDVLKKTWKGASSSARENSYLVDTYCKKLKELNENEIAEKIILNFLKKTFDEILVYTYISLNQDQSDKVIKKISQWQKRYENNSKLMRIHAEVLMKNQRWEEAKECIEKAIEINPDSKNYFILGEILFHFGKVDSACETYRKSIRAKSRETIKDN
tara:strand:+ start:3941 stop:5119 length:1179 start_codon:yes stop_codon:yes gene_type:complete